MCIFAPELRANKVGTIENMVYTYPTYTHLLEVIKVTSLGYSCTFVGGG